MYSTPKQSNRDKTVISIIKESDLSVDPFQFHMSTLVQDLSLRMTKTKIITTLEPVRVSGEAWYQRSRPFILISSSSIDEIPL